MRDFVDARHPVGMGRRHESPVLAAIICGRIFSRRSAPPLGAVLGFSVELFGDMVAGRVICCVVSADIVRARRRPRAEVDLLYSSKLRMCLKSAWQANIKRQIGYRTYLACVTSKGRP